MRKEVLRTHLLANSYPLSMHNAQRTLTNRGETPVKNAPLPAKRGREGEEHTSPSPRGFRDPEGRTLNTAAFPPRELCRLRPRPRAAPQLPLGGRAGETLLGDSLPMSITLSDTFPLMTDRSCFANAPAHVGRGRKSVAEQPAAPPAGTRQARGSTNGKKRTHAARLVRVY